MRVGVAGVVGLIDRPHALASTRGQLVAEVRRGGVKKTFAGTTLPIRTKTDTGRRGEYPQALERTVVKELGKLTPYLRNKGSLPTLRIYVLL